MRVSRLSTAGMTLVELLVVIAIICLIAWLGRHSIWRPTMRNVAMTDVAMTKTKVSSLANGLSQYVQDEGVFPGQSLSGVDPESNLFSSPVRRTFRGTETGWARWPILTLSEGQGNRCRCLGRPLRTLSLGRSRGDRRRSRRKVHRRCLGRAARLSRHHCASSSHGRQIPYAHLLEGTRRHRSNCRWVERTERRHRKLVIDPSTFLASHLRELDRVLVTHARQALGNGRTTLRGRSARLQAHSVFRLGNEPTEDDALNLRSSRARTRGVLVLHSQSSADGTRNVPTTGLFGWERALAI